MHPEFLYVAVALDKSALMVTGAPNNWDTSELAAFSDSTLAAGALCALGDATITGRVAIKAGATLPAPATRTERSVDEVIPLCYQRCQPALQSSPRMFAFLFLVNNV